MLIDTGSKTALPTLIERDIAEVVAFMSDCGNPMDRDRVCDLVQSFCEKMDHSVKQFTNNRPGVDWCRGFESRWSHIPCRRREGLAYNRQKGLYEHNVKSFYKLFDDLVKENRICHENMYNCDESGFQTNNGGNLLHMKRQNRHNYDMECDNTKEKFTVMLTCSATGS